MTRRAAGAFLLVILTVVGACSPVSPTPLPTRTPKPTFTVAAGAATVPPAPTETTRSASQVGPSATPSAEPQSISTESQPTASVAAAVSPTPTSAPSATLTATPTATAEPSPTPAPTIMASPTAEPTATPVPTATPLPCPEGYALHVQESLGFSVCYPQGWLVSDYEDPENGARGVSFDAPGSDRVTGAALQFATVQVAPNTTGLEGEAYIEAKGTALINQYMEVLVGWPYTLTLDGQAGVEIAYEAALPYGNEIIAVLGWRTLVLVDGQEWTIEVVGRGEYRDGMEAFHTAFMESLLFLSLHDG